MDRTLEMTDIFTSCTENLTLVTVMVLRLRVEETRSNIGEVMVKQWLGDRHGL